MKIGVIGAGSWGTALAGVLSDNGHEVKLWTNMPEQALEINTYHTNKRYLGEDYLLNHDIFATTIEEDLVDSEILLFVLPTNVTRLVVKNFCKVIENMKDVVICHASKGLEQKTFDRLSVVIEEELSNYFGEGLYDHISSINVLSGPSHAEEVALKDLTVVAVAGSKESDLKILQQAFSNNYFRVYTNNDLSGVETSGALKNIYAFASGALSGLGYGDNARAGLISRSLVEMARYLDAVNGSSESVYGLSGVGDLIVTATSVHSRNWQAGNKLGKSANDAEQNLTTKEIVERMDMVVEGVLTAKVVYEQIQQLNIEMPIATAIYKVIYEGANIHEEINKLMQREFKCE